MRIGSVRIAHAVTLAPLEEHSNYPFRLLMKQCGASLVCTERVDAAAGAPRATGHATAVYGARRGPAGGPDQRGRPGRDGGRRPGGGGVGLRPGRFELRCPIRRLLARGEGGALLADPAAVARIVAAVVRAVSIPVTLKIRSGPDAACETAVEIARVPPTPGPRPFVCMPAAWRKATPAGPIGPWWPASSRRWRFPCWAAAASVRPPMCGGSSTPAERRGGHRPRLLGQPLDLSPGSHAGGRRGGPRLAHADATRAGAVQLVEGEFPPVPVPLALRRLARTSGYFVQFLPHAAAFRAALGEVKSLHQFRRLLKQHWGV